jgi:hypothetical protein
LWGARNYACTTPQRHAKLAVRQRKFEARCGIDKALVQLRGLLHQGAALAPQRFSSKESSCAGLTGFGSATQLIGTQQGVGDDLAGFAGTKVQTFIEAPRESVSLGPCRKGSEPVVDGQAGKALDREAQDGLVTGQDSRKR